LINADHVFAVALHAADLLIFWLTFPDQPGVRPDRVGVQLQVRPSRRNSEYFS
jgi:hypothetical protein